MKTTAQLKNLATLACTVSGLLISTSFGSPQVLFDFENGTAEGWTTVSSDPCVPHAFTVTNALTDNGEALPIVPALLPPGKTQQLTSPDQVPEGVAKSDWASIRAAYEAGRHAFQPTATGWQARNPGQQWTTTFDQRGFLAQPEDGAWQWGLELQSYGFGESQRAIGGTPAVQAAGQRLSYQWDTTVQEWFVNDPRGLEHGFTVSQRPAAAPNSQPSTLSFLLATRGTLRPSVSADAKGVLFQDAHGATVLNYTGLKVWDADGQVLTAHFEVAGQNRVRLLVDERAARYPITIDPIAQQAYLKASNTELSDAFGGSVAVSGDTVVVGAGGEDSNATGVNGDQSDNSVSGSGAAYVFVRNGTNWSQQAYLKASNPEPGDNFGWSVAVSGDTVVVGAVAEDSNATGVNGDQSDNSVFGAGAAYVFVRSGTNWSQQAYFKASNPGENDLFGDSVAVSGDTVVVGARLEASNASGVNGNQSDNSVFGSGAVYVFVRNGTNWSQQAYLKASNPERADGFGGSVAVSGDTVVVGARAEDSNASGVDGDQSDNSAGASGAAYVFVRSAGEWSQQAYLKASNPEGADFFGSSVAVSGDTVVVGAENEDSNASGVNGDQSDNSAPFAGAAYVFVHNGTSWSQQAYLKASNTEANDLFGVSVAVSGDTVVVGATGEDSNATGVNGNQSDNGAPFANSSGAAYVFTGLGIAPELAVPLMGNVQFDGIPNTRFEFINAARLPMNYGPAAGSPSAPYALLAHDDDFLYIGSQIPQNNLAWGEDSSEVRFYFDPKFSRLSQPDADHWYLSIKPYAANIDPQWFQGNGTEGFSRVLSPPFQWGALVELTGDDVSPTYTYEIRVSRAFLGSWDEIDGFAIEHREPSQTYPAPQNAVSSNPATWARLTYRPNPVALARATHGAPGIDFGPLSLGLFELPIDPALVVTLRAGTPLGGGSIGYRLADVLSAELIFGDVIGMNLTEFYLEVAGNGETSALSYTFAALDSPTAVGIVIMNGVIGINGFIGMERDEEGGLSVTEMPFSVTGTDILSGQAFSYTYANSTVRQIRSKSLLDVIFDTPVINSGPLSFGLSELPAQPQPVFFLGEGTPAGGGATGYGLDDVVSARLAFGDGIFTRLTAFDMEIRADGTFEALSFTFSPLDTPSVSDGGIVMNSPLFVSGTDTASGEAFSYTYANSAATVRPVPDPLPIALRVVGRTGDTLTLAVENILNGQTFHLRQSTDLVNFEPLSPPVDITATTPQPMAITVDPTVRSKLFFTVYPGLSPAP